jgi:hypothetical protein
VIADLRRDVLAWSNYTNYKKMIYNYNDDRVVSRGYLSKEIGIVGWRFDGHKHEFDISNLQVLSA